MAEARSYRFRRTQRLRSRAEFSAVFEQGVRQSRFPLTLWAKANTLSYPRLGISMSRRVGTAARRNRIKRLLREAFRMLQHDLPRGYDLAVAVKPHEPLMLADYQRTLMALVLKAQAVDRRKNAGGAGSSTPKRPAGDGRESHPPPQARGDAGRDEV